MKPRLATLSLALALGAACGGPGPIDYYSRGDQPATADGLYRVRARGVLAAFLDPGASFADYDALLIDPLPVSYKGGPEGEIITSRSRGTFSLGEGTRGRLQRIFAQTFQRELARSEAFAVVTEAGPRVLRVSGQIVNLVVTVPPLRGGEVNLVHDAGEMTLILEVRDSETGEPLARIADRRLIQPASASALGGFESSAVNNWGAVRDIFAEWARFLRQGLDDLHRVTRRPR